MLLKSPDQMLSANLSPLCSIALKVLQCFPIVPHVPTLELHLQTQVQVVSKASAVVDGTLMLMRYRVPHAATGAI